MTAAFPTSANMNGTVGWTLTDLTSTTAILNVTHDLTISSGDSTPVIRNTGSFNESVDLASRLVSIFPDMMPEMDRFLQEAQSTTSTSLPGVNLTRTMSTVESFIPNRSLYTIWWVNGPLKLNETVPVLVLPTNVTRSSIIDLGGSIGNRDAWTLDFNFSRPLIVPDPSVTTASIQSGRMEVGVALNYDKTSDLLLSATAELHSGFEDVIPISASSCIPSSSMECPVTSSPAMVLGSFGVDIEASLKLTSTNLDLSQRMTSTTPTQSSGGSDDGNGPSTSGGTGSDNNSGASHISNGNGANGSTGQQSSVTNQQAPGGQVSSWPLWVFALLGVSAAIIVASIAPILWRRWRNARLDGQSGQVAY